MLFSNKIDRACAYCVHSTELNSNVLLCARKGVVMADSKCIKFKYDPCKRIPLKPKAQGFEKYTDEDFKL